MKLTYIPLMLCISLLIFNSCDKDSIDKDPQIVYDQVEISYKEKAEDTHTDCFDMVYPVSYTMPDNSVVVHNSKEDTWETLKALSKSHSGSDFSIDIVLPVTVVLHKNQSEFIVTSDEEWARIKKDCEWKPTDKCYDMVYPVLYTLPDNSVVTHYNKEDVWNTVKTWYEANDESDLDLNLVFPLTIIFHKDGSKRIIENEEEWEIVKEQCKK